MDRSPAVSATKCLRNVNYYYFHATILFLLTSQIENLVDVSLISQGNSPSPKKKKRFSFGLSPWSDDGRNWGPEEKGTTEDEMAGWHH